MKEKEEFKVKVGKNVRVIAGKHRNGNFVVKRIDRKRNVVFLENISKIVFVMNRRERKRQAKEVFSPIHISNVRPTE